MTQTAPLPDADASNWVDRHAPAAFKPWLKLGRFDRPTHEGARRLGGNLDDARLLRR